MQNAISDKSIIDICDMSERENIKINNAASLMKDEKITI
jgi:hypothetical protein